MSYIVGSILSDWQERVTQSPKYIDTDHAYIHEGAAFDAWDFAAALSGSRVCGLVIPADKYLHFRPANLAVASGMAHFRLFLCATSTGTALSGGSTAFAPVNRNHNSTQASVVAFRTGADTSSTAGYVEKYSTKVFGGTGPGQTRMGGSKGEPLEWVLNPNRTYAVYVTTTAATEYGLNLFWYEEDGG